MECSELADRLTDFLEGELDAETEAVAVEHLASCEHCERVLAQTRSVTAIVSEHGRADVPVVARDRMWRTIAAGIRSHRD